MYKVCKESDRFPEVASVLIMGMGAYTSRYGSQPSHYWKVINALKNCRTSALGGHSYKCDTCDYNKNVYNSCRDRHCPKCQGLTRAEWLADRQADLLDVPYFHVVFTLPAELAAIAFVMGGAKVFHGRGGIVPLLAD